MRRGIEAVPKDGKIVILEDDASGTYELARWSAEAGAWVGENGEPSKITPTYWHATRRDEYLLQSESGSRGTSESRERPSFPFCPDGVTPHWPSAAPDVIAPRRVAIPSPMNVVALKSQIPPGEAQAGRRFAISSIAAAVIAASLIGVFFRGEVAAYVTQFAGRHDIRIGTTGGQLPKAIQFPIEDSQKADLFSRGAVLRQQAQADGGSEQTAAWEAVQVTETKAPEAIQPLEKERRRANSLENELTEIRRSIERRDVQLQAAALTAAQSQERDSEKTAALIQDLAAARQELMANEVQYRGALAEERDRSAALVSELATARRQVETQVALSNKTGNEAAQLNPAAETAISELQQSLKQERERAEALAGELAQARREVEAQAALSSKKGDEAAQLKRAAEKATAELQQSLQQERERAEALAGDLVEARREVEAQAELSTKNADEAAHFKLAAEIVTAELQQSLEQQRDKTLALEGELAMARRYVEIEVARPNKTNKKAGQRKQAAQNAQAELQQPLQQERDKSEGLAPGPKSTRGPIGARLALEGAASPQTTRVRQAAGAAAAEQIETAEANGSPEATRLLERANALLGQGNIGAARAVLERAAETGSSQAIFMLAETYDPLVLSKWRTYGTRGDATKARELYDKAYDSGIKTAKDRSDALLGAEGGRRPAGWFGREEIAH
jgi:hypothetical protein